VVPSTETIVSSLLVQFAATYFPEPSLYCANAPSVAPVDGKGPSDVIGRVKPSIMLPPPTGVMVRLVIVAAGGVGAVGSSLTVP
jgi:hypothetical protein